MIILLDAMGGDNAPDAVIKGAVRAAKEIKSEICLIGDTKIINDKVKEFFGKDKIEEVASNIKIQHATETISMEDIPTQAIRQKKDSSMVVGFNMLKEGKGDVFISAGNSGETGQHCAPVHCYRNSGGHLYQQCCCTEKAASQAPAGVCQLL